MLGAGLPQFACTQPVLGTPKPAEITSDAEPQELPRSPALLELTSSHAQAGQVNVDCAVKNEIARSESP
jgi:hypothetical protein